MSTIRGSLRDFALFFEHKFGDDNSMFHRALAELERLESELAYADAINAELHAMLERVRMRAK